MLLACELYVSADLQMGYHGNDSVSQSRNNPPLTSAGYRAGSGEDEAADQDCRRGLSSIYFNGHLLLPCLYICLFLSLSLCGLDLSCSRQ